MDSLGRDSVFGDARNRVPVPGKGDVLSHRWTCGFHARPASCLYCFLHVAPARMKSVVMYLGKQSSRGISEGGSSMGDLQSLEVRPYSFYSETLKKGRQSLYPLQLGLGRLLVTHHKMKGASWHIPRARSSASLNHAISMQLC